MSESRTDQPRTRPVAFLRKSAGLSWPTASVAMHTSHVCADQGRRGRTTCVQGVRQYCSTIHEKVFADLALLRVQFEHGALQDAITIDAAGIDGEGPPHLFYPPAFVDVPVHTEHGLIAIDCIPDGLRPDRFHDRAAVNRAQRRVQRRRLVEAGPVGWRVEV